MPFVNAFVYLVIRLKISYRHEVAFDGGKIFVVGGGTSTEVHSLTKIWTFYLAKKSWKLIVTEGDGVDNNLYPSPRRCHGSVQMNKGKLAGQKVFFSNKNVPSSNGFRFSIF